ncbi:hypothetical protein ABVL22_004314 [Salmonella enterica]
MEKSSTFWINILVIAAVLLGIVLGLLDGSNRRNEIYEYKNKYSSYWIHDCKLIEKNIRRTWNSTQNRLQCNEVIENVDSELYEEVMKEAASK